MAGSFAVLVLSPREIAAAPVQVSPPALFGLAGCILTWLVCYRASIQDLHITLFPLIFWLAVTATFGLRTGLLLTFPVAFFYLAVPSWSQLGNSLQELTVFALRGLFWLAGPAVLICG